MNLLGHRWGRFLGRMAISGLALFLVSRFLRADDGVGSKPSQMPWELLSDLNNDGEIDVLDSRILARSRSPQATADDRFFAIEYMFANDSQANGAGDREDPVYSRPLVQAGGVDDKLESPLETDDDAEGLRLFPIGVGTNGKLPTGGALWFEAEGIDLKRLRFYDSATCETEVVFPYEVGLKVVPGVLHLRVEENMARNSVPCRLSLVWGSVDGREVYGRSILNLLIVPGVGADRFRHAVRDYIEEKNATHYFRRVKLPSHTASLCFFLTEQTQVRGINARNAHKGAGAPSIYRLAEDPALLGCAAVINTSYGYGAPKGDGYWSVHQGSLVHEGKVDGTCSIPNEQAKSGGEKGCVYSTKTGTITFAPRKLDRRKPQWLAGRAPFAESNAPWGKSYLPRPGATLLMAADGVEPPVDAWEGSGGLVPERMNSVLLKEYLMIGEVSDLYPRRSGDVADYVSPVLTEKKLVFVAACDRASGSESPNRVELWEPLRKDAADYVMYDADPGTSVALAVADPFGRLRVRGIPGVTHEPEKSGGPVFFLKTYLGLVAKRVR